MDPNKALSDLLDWADENADTDETAQLFLSLDEWLSKGGFLPDRWKRLADPKHCWNCGRPLTDGEQETCCLVDEEMGRPDLSFPAVSPDLRPAFNAAKDHEINLGDL